MILKPDFESILKTFGTCPNANITVMQEKLRMQKEIDKLKSKLQHQKIELLKQKYASEGHDICKAVMKQRQPRGSKYRLDWDFSNADANIPGLEEFKHPAFLPQISEQRLAKSNPKHQLRQSQQPQTQSSDILPKTTKSLQKRSLSK